MKTSIKLDDDKVALARKLGQAKTLRELVDHALDAYIQQVRRQGMADLLGTGFFNDDLQKMRKRENGRSRR